MSKEAEHIADGLSEAQRRAVLYCEGDGNGRHVYQIHGLAHKGLMGLTPIPELQGISAYRLTPLGLRVRAVLEAREAGHG